jgi:hypothetical protein
MPELTKFDNNFLSREIGEKLQSNTPLDSLDYLLRSKKKNTKNIFTRNQTS